MLQEVVEEQKGDPAQIEMPKNLPELISEENQSKYFLNHLTLCFVVKIV